MCIIQYNKLINCNSNNRNREPAWLPLIWNIGFGTSLALLELVKDGLME